MFIERDLAPSLDIVFIDEAQDLSPLQWAMVNKIVDKSKQVFIAGDDDQAIYRWAGADVDHFITLAGHVEVLTQSYRMPVSHHALSQNLISRISNRRKKDFRPRSEDGTVSWYRHSEEVDLTRGEWLLLSRTRRGATQIEQEVRQRGFLYSYDAGQELELLLQHLVQLLRRDGSVRRHAADSHGLAELERDVAVSADIPGQQHARLVGELDACHPKGVHDGEQRQLALLLDAEDVGRIRRVVGIRDNDALGRGGVSWRVAGHLETAGA